MFAELHFCRGAHSCPLIIHICFVTRFCDQLIAVEKRHLLPGHSQGYISFLLVKQNTEKASIHFGPRLSCQWLQRPSKHSGQLISNNAYYVSFTWVLKHRSCYTLEVPLKLLITCFASRATLAMCKTHMVPLLENYDYIPEFEMQTWKASLKMCTVQPFQGYLYMCNGSWCVVLRVYPGVCMN